MFRGSDKLLTNVQVLLLFWSCTALAGCAALTNPVADGIPVQNLPPELLAQTRKGEQVIPMSLLALKAPSEYRLDGGDVLGVWIEGVLDDKTLQSPVPQARVLEKTRRFPDLAWRVVWGESVATSEYSAFIDATTGDFLQRTR